MAQIKVNAMSFALLIRDILEGQYTCEELAQRTGLHYVTVLNYTRQLYKVKAIHVHAWRMNAKRQYTLRIYAIGDKPDALKPRKAMTTAERTYRYRMKLKREAECSSPTPDLPPKVSDAGSTNPAR